MAQSLRARKAFVVQKCWDHLVGVCHPTELGWLATGTELVCEKKGLHAMGR